MSKKLLSLALVIIAILSVLTAWLLLPRTQPPEQAKLYDFENGLGDWATDAQVPIDPDTGEPVEWRIEPSTNVSFSGNSSALFYIDGAQDDGTIWIERKLILQANTTRPVNVTFQLWSSTESFTTLAAAVGYVGEKNPEEETDFQVLGVTNQISGWKNYSLSAEVETGSTGEIYVAVGISVRWETDLTYFIDYVALTSD